MAYTTINKPSLYFNTVLYTGTGSGGSNRQITGVGFQPDWVWVKTRGSIQEHVLADVVRGATAALDTSANTAEEITTTRIGSFISDGFQLGSGAVQNRVNENGVGLVAWNWKANGAGVSNTQGSITSTVSANTTSGFSIVSYTGTGANATIGHGLGVAPAMVIIKDRDTAVNWSVNHQPLCASLSDYTRYLTLDSTSAVSGAGNVQYQNTAFTSTVFNVGTSTVTNNNTKRFIAYCFANVKGFSKIGLYTGNGNADGTFIYTGFKPAFVMRKRTDSAADWRMDDSKRDGYNVIPFTLFPNLANEETTNSGYNVDLLSNGFKCRGTSVNQNASGGTYIYAAFAENPFVSSTLIPTTAR